MFPNLNFGSWACCLFRCFPGVKMTELNDFLNNILPKIGEESCARIGDTLKANNFTSRLPLKLLSPENLNVLFAEIKLSLGSERCYRISFGIAERLISSSWSLAGNSAIMLGDLLHQQASTNSKVQQQTSTNREEQVRISLFHCFMWDSWCYYNYICILLVKLLYI